MSIDTTMDLDIGRVEDSFALIEPRLEELAKAFYDELFGSYPQVLPLFEDVDLPAQRHKFGAMLTLIVTSLRRMDVLITAVRMLGAKHVEYGTTREGYDWVEASLMVALEKTAGDAWDEPTAQAWRSALGIVITQMIAGHDGEGQFAAGPATAGGTTKRTRGFGLAGGTTHGAMGGESADEIDFLMEIASNPSLSFNRDSLFTNFIEKKKLDYEMALAQTVQQSLIPVELPTIDGYKFDARYQPAMHVGGDYYDWILQESGHLCLVVGDVSGKGVPGALIMCKLAGIVRAVLAADQSVDKAMDAINVHMCDRMPGGRFVTLAIARIDLKTHAFELASAGHLPPVHWRGPSMAYFVDTRTGGIPIGIDRDANYLAIKGDLGPGEALMYYTDGINEAAGPKRSMYGMDRLCAQASEAKYPAELLPVLFNDLRTFTRGRPQSDDITVFTVYRS